MQKTVFKNKFLTVLFSMLFAIASVFVLTACGEDPNNSSNNNSSSTSLFLNRVEVNNTHWNSDYSRLEYVYGDEIDIDKTMFTVYYFDNSGQEQTLTQNDFNIDTSSLVLNDENKVNAGSYSINITLIGNQSSQTPVSVYVEKQKVVVPTFTQEQLTLTYSGAERNIITEAIDSVMETENIPTLSQLISSGKVAVDERGNYGDNYTTVATNALGYGATNGQSYMFSVSGTSNYEIVTSLDQQYGGNQFIMWYIAPKVLNMPTYANEGKVAFDWEVDSQTGEVQMKTAQMSLVYGTTDDDVKVNMVDITSGSLTLDYYGSSNVILTLKEAYATNYALDESWYLTYKSMESWEVTPYIFDASHFTINTTNADGTYHYDTDDKDYPNFAYNPEGLTIGNNLTAKEKQLFDIYDSGAAWVDHFANDGDSVYSYGFSLCSEMQNYSSAFRVGSLESAFNSSDLTQYYHISRIDAPTAVQTAIAGYTLELEPRTYDGDFPVTLSENYSLNSFTTTTQEQFNNEVYRQGLSTNDESIFVLRQTQDVSNANESGYTVALNFYYGRINYNPIAVSAKFVVNRQSHIIYSISSSFSDNDSNSGCLIYRYNSPVTLSISSAWLNDIEDLSSSDFAAITYKYSATENGTYNTVSNAINAGFYKAITYILVEDTNHKYELNEAGVWTIEEDSIDATKFILTRSFQIEKRPISYIGNISGNWGMQNMPYCFAGTESKTIGANITGAYIWRFTSSGDTVLSSEEAQGSELLEIMNYFNAPELTTTFGSNTVTSFTAVGAYETQISYTLKNTCTNYMFIGEDDGMQEWGYGATGRYGFRNYLVSSKTSIINWEILSKTIDASAVAFDQTTFTYSSNNSTPSPRLTNLPKGVKVSYYFRYVDSNSQLSGQSWAPGYGGSNYRVQATITADNTVLGYDGDVTIVYPAGYDTTNGYWEQSYTINPLELTLAISDFGVIISTDSYNNNGTIAGRLNAEGKISVNIEFYGGSSTRQPRIIILNDQDERSGDTVYINDHFDYDNSTFPAAGDAVGTSGVITGTIKAWEGVVLVNGEVPFEITWTIVAGE